MYIIRSNKPFRFIGEVSDEIAFKLSSTCKGRMESVDMTNLGTHICFVFEESFLYGTSSVKLAIYDGDVLYREKN